MTTIETHTRSQVAATIADRDDFLAYLSDRAGGRPVSCLLCDERVSKVELEHHLEAHAPRSARR